MYVTCLRNSIPCSNQVSEVYHLSELPQLTELVLKENPICQSQMYQIEVLTALRASCLEVSCSDSRWVSMGAVVTVCYHML